MAYNTKLLPTTKEFVFTINDRFLVKLRMKENIKIRSTIRVNFLVTGYIKSLSENAFFDICPINDALMAAQAFINPPKPFTQIYQTNYQKLHVKKFDTFTDEALLTVVTTLFYWLKLDQVYDITVDYEKEEETSVLIAEVNPKPMPWYRRVLQSVKRSKNHGSKIQ